MLPTKFSVNKLFGLGEEAQNSFLRWPPSWISDQKDFSYFWPITHIYKRDSEININHPDASYQVSSQLAFQFRRRREK